MMLTCPRCKGHGGGPHPDAWCPVCRGARMVAGFDFVDVRRPSGEVVEQRAGSGSRKESES